MEYNINYNKCTICDCYNEPSNTSTMVCGECQNEGLSIDFDTALLRFFNNSTKSTSEDHD